MRSEPGEEMVLDKNFFVERIVPSSMLEPPSEETMAEYRRPFRDPGESRRPTLTWPREIPIDGEPADVNEIAALNYAWLGSSDVPKLFVNADPGSILTGRVRDACRDFPNQTEVTVPGLHYIQEDSGAQIGRAIAVFLQGL
jgi:haloalkane dehalogenase